jgi:hypothetical protein
LQDAVQVWLLAEGKISSSPVLHPVAAVSVGIVAMAAGAGPRLRKIRAATPT